MNCGDCYFETHYEKELFEHVKMHIDQLEKRTTNVQNGHKNKTWTLYGDWEYATTVEEELVNHVGFFSILRDDEDDDVPTEGMSDDEACHKKEAEKVTRGVETWRQTQEVIEKEMSDEETRHKKEAEKAKEDEERWEEKEKEIEAKKGKKGN